MQSERPTTELWVRMRKKNHGRGLKGRQRSQTWDGECASTHVLRPLQQQNPMRNGIYALEMETQRKLTYGRPANPPGISGFIPEKRCLPVAPDIGKKLPDWRCVVRATPPPPPPPPPAPAPQLQPTRARSSRVVWCKGHAVEKSTEARFTA